MPIELYPSCNPSLKSRCILTYIQQKNKPHASTDQFFFRTVLDFFALKLRRKRGEFEYVLVPALVFIQRNLLGIRYVLPIQLKKTQDGNEMNSNLVSFHP